MSGYWIPDSLGPDTHKCVRPTTPQPGATWTCDHCTASWVRTAAGKWKPVVR